MPSTLDFAKLDLRSAFDFAIMIEEDAQARYAQLAELLGDDPGGAGGVFRAMVATEGKHRLELTARRAALFRDHPPRFEISVIDDGGVERPEVDDDELPRTAREALEVCLAAERRAREFYRSALPHVRDPGVRAFFAGLEAEELEHEALLARKLAGLPAPGARPAAPAPRRAAAPARTPETFPDRAALEGALPRFDAATQAVAASVIVDGVDPATVAERLGVSRRTVAWKLARFLAIARQHAAATVAVAALTGCTAAAEPVAPPRSVQAEAQRPCHAVALADAPVAPSPGGAVAAATASAREAARAAEPRESRNGLAGRILAQVEARMPRHDPAVHRRVARAIHAEAQRAGLDPLLVLALIHVESSFNPHAVSSAGAVGLMQLLEPTMRRELERSGLGAADPRDPVANVQAGVRYLRRLVDAFGGEMDAALMAYNAGPNRIRGHLRKGGIPERFHVYPKKVKGELSRLRTALAPGGGSGTLAVSGGGRGPSSPST